MRTLKSSGSFHFLNLLKPGLDVFVWIAHLAHILFP